MTSDQEDWWLETLRAGGDEVTLTRQQADELADILEGYFKRDAGKHGRPKYESSKKQEREWFLQDLRHVVFDQMDVGKSWEDATRDLVRDEQKKIRAITGRKKLPDRRSWERMKCVRTYEQVELGMPLEEAIRYVDSQEDEKLTPGKRLTLYTLRKYCPKRLMLRILSIAGNLPRSRESEKHGEKRAWLESNNLAKLKRST
jgi:hypothetical protein